MSVTVRNNVVRMTADNDTYGDGSNGPIKVQAVRLVSGGSATVATIRATDENGDILMKLKAGADAIDESRICFRSKAGMIHVDIDQTGSEVYLYLEG